MRMKKINKAILCIAMLIMTSVMMVACGVIEVRGKTFVFIWCDEKYPFFVWVPSEFQRLVAESVAKTLE